MPRQTCAPSIDIGQLPRTPLGALWVAISDFGLVAVDWAKPGDDFLARFAKRYAHPGYSNPETTSQVINELHEYLEGERRVFTIPIDWSVLRPFQQKVLQLTFSIPFGETRTYGELAATLGNPKAARAVGRAQATNPMPLVIPCHRVIGSDGKLHGYGGGEGLATKEWLLRMEGAILA
ncbi:MAG: methylated-DNA--[protein]-cysteine S-methyltransferase [Chloroflexota bacterium]